MQITDFVVPQHPPTGLLKGYVNAHEKETFLVMVLIHCHEVGDLDAPMALTHEHPAMVDDGLLYRVGLYTYKLTEKAKGLLYSVYHK